MIKAPNNSSEYLKKAHFSPVQIEKIYTVSSLAAYQECVEHCLALLQAPYNLTHSKIVSLVSKRNGVEALKRIVDSYAAFIKIGFNLTDIIDVAFKSDIYETLLEEIADVIPPNYKPISSLDNATTASSCKRKRLSNDSSAVNNRTLESMLEQELQEFLDEYAAQELNVDNSASESLPTQDFGTHRFFSSLPTDEQPTTLIGDEQKQQSNKNPDVN